MKALALLALAACSSASPEPASTAKPKDAAPTTRHPTPGQETIYLATPRTCGIPGGTTPPKSVVQLTAGSESCARLADGSVWCWGANGMMRIDADVLAPVACAVATRVEALDVVDDLWQVGQDTCVAAKRAVRCGRLTSGFDPQVTPLDARSAFQWDGLPCAITRDRRIRCLRDDKTKEGAGLAPVEQVAFYGSALCVLSRTAVTCRRDGKIEVLASKVKQLSGGDWLWALRSDHTVVRLGVCSDGPGYKPCSFPITGVTDPIAIASTSIDACVLSRDGNVACTTCSAKGPCTDAVTTVAGLTDVTQIAVGWGHACALRRTGEVVCWGGSDCGQSGGAAEAGKRCGHPTTQLPPTTILWAR